MLLLLLLLPMLLLSQTIHLCSVIWGIFHNGRKPDGAMPCGGRRPTGCKLLFYYQAALTKQKKSLACSFFFLSSVMNLDCICPDNVVNGFFWCTTLSSLLNRENAENVSRVVHSTYLKDFQVCREKYMGPLPTA
jgi:hypothetical protein